MEKLREKVQGWFTQLATKKFGEFGDILFLRCISCHRLNLPKDLIKTTACPCGSSRFSPTNPTFFEEIKLVGKLIYG